MAFDWQNFLGGGGLTSVGQILSALGTHSTNPADPGIAMQKALSDVAARNLNRRKLQSDEEERKRRAALEEKADKRAENAEARSEAKALVDRIVGAQQQTAASDLSTFAGDPGNQGVPLDQIMGSPHAQGILATGAPGEYLKQSAQAAFPKATAPTNLSKLINERNAARSAGDTERERILSAKIADEESGKDSVSQTYMMPLLAKASRGEAWDERDHKVFETLRKLDPLSSIREGISRQIAPDVQRAFKQSREPQAVPPATQEQGLVDRVLGVTGAPSVELPLDPSAAGAPGVVEPRLKQSVIASGVSPDVVKRLESGGRALTAEEVARMTPEQKNALEAWLRTRGAK